MTIQEYCDKNYISVRGLAKICGVEYGVLWGNVHNNENISLKTARKIYAGTKRQYGVGLALVDYLQGDTEFLAGPREVSEEPEQNLSADIE